MEGVTWVNIELIRNMVKAYINWLMVDFSLVIGFMVSKMESVLTILKMVPSNLDSGKMVKLFNGLMNQLSMKSYWLPKVILKMWVVITNPILSWLIRPCVPRPPLMQF